MAGKKPTANPARQAAVEVLRRAGAPVKVAEIARQVLKVNCCWERRRGTVLTGGPMLGRWAC